MPPKTLNGINLKKRRKKNPPPEKSPPLSASIAPSSPDSTIPPPPASIASPPPTTITSPPPVATGEATPPHSPLEISPPRQATISPPPPITNEEQLNLPELPQDNDEDTQPIPPEFYLDQSNYTKWCKLSSRSEESRTIAELDKILGEDEKNWFRLHPQFQHIWHMPREDNHKYTGMWLLLLRTVRMDKDRVCWFVVNGVPIRYSLREHGLISGLDCRIYPPNYENLGSLEFVERNFEKEEEEEEEEEEDEEGKKKIVVTIKDVKEKLCSMQACGDRLKMAILLFLSTIIAPSKKYGYIDPFLLRIVDNVRACETFPWGRYTFDDTITNIFHMMKHFKGRVNSSWCFPGFLTPLKILACECIPNLKSRFRVDVVGAITNCPRMCKQKWRDNHMKGYPIEDVNSALGSTTEIQSILEPELSEVPLMASITEGDEIQSSDPLAVTWEQRLCVEMKKICWKKLHDLDVDSRRRNVTEEQQEEELIPPQSSRTVNSLKYLESKLMRAMNAGFKELNKKIDKKYNLLNRRVTDIELCVNGALNKSKGKDVSVDGEMETGFEKEASVDGEMGTEFEKEGNEANEMADKEDEVATGEEDDEIEAIEDSAGNEVERTDDELTGEEDEAATCSEADEMETENINESQPCDKMLKRTREVSQYGRPPYTEGKKKKKKSEPAK